MNKIECKEFEYYINNPKSEDAKINAIGTAYTELANRVLTNHPELDEDRVRDYCWEYVNVRLRDGKSIVFKTFGVFMSHAERDVVLHYTRMEKKYIPTLPLDDYLDVADSTENLVEECLDRIVLEKMAELLKVRIDMLSPKSKAMLCIKYLSNDGQGTTMQEIADALGLSTSRINEIIQKALKNLSRTKLTNRESELVELKRQNMSDAVIRNQLNMPRDTLNNAVKRVKKVKLSKEIKELYDLL